LVALDDGRIGVAREGGFEELAKIHGDVEQLVSVAGSVHAVTATRARTELWRITPRVERLGAIDPPAIAVAGGEIVFVRQDQIFVGERPLIDLPREERIRVSTARKLA